MGAQNWASCAAFETSCNVLFFHQKLPKKCLFPRFWAIFAKNLEKKCNFCATLFLKSELTIQPLELLYMSYFSAKNRPKSKNFLYFEHFFPKLSKKSAIFVQLVKRAKRSVHHLDPPNRLKLARQTAHRGAHILKWSFLNVSSYTYRQKEPKI